MSILFSRQPSDVWMTQFDISAEEENVLCGITVKKLEADMIHETYLLYIDAGLSVFTVSANIPQNELCNIFDEEAQWIKRRSLDMSDSSDDIRVWHHRKNVNRLFYCLETFPANTRRRVRRCS